MLKYAETFSNIVSSANRKRISVDPSKWYKLLNRALMPSNVYEEYKKNYDELMILKNKVSLKELCAKSGEYVFNTVFDNAYEYITSYNNYISHCKNNDL